MADPMDVKALVEMMAQAIAGDEWPADGVEVDERGNDYADLGREPYRMQARRALVAALPMLVDHLIAVLDASATECRAAGLPGDPATLHSAAYTMIAEGARLAAALEVR